MATALEFIFSRNQFYAKNYKHLVYVNIIFFLILGLTIGLFFYRNINDPLPVYFPTTPDGKLIYMPPLNKNHLRLDKIALFPDGRLVDYPILNIKDVPNDAENGLVLYWTATAAKAMFNIDYINYRRSIQEVRSYFTASGHREYIQALADSKNLETVKNRKAVVNPVIKQSPKIIKSGIVQGRLAWKIDVPVTITYETTKKGDPLVQNLIAKLFVVRTSTLESPFFGLAIVQANFVEEAN